MMKFNNIKRAALLLLAGVSIACSEGPDETAEEISQSIPQEEAPIFSAEIINQPADESRAYVDMTDYYVRWKTGDKISAFIKGSRTPSSYILKTGNGETVATFGAAGDVTSGSKSINCAVYPEDAAATFANGSITYHMPATQTYKPGSYAGLEPHMLAHLITDEQFEFRSFVGYIALKLYTDETTPVRIKSVKLETPSGEPISGTMSIYAGVKLTEHHEGGTIATGSNAVTLDCGEEGVLLSTDKSTPTLLGLALPVKFRDETGTGGYEGLKFTVTDTEGRTMELTTDRNIGVARGYTTTMAPKLYKPVDPDNAIDLSIAPDGTQQPSNCYVVPGPGRYKFPTRYVNKDVIYKYDNYGRGEASYDDIDWMWKTEGVDIGDFDYKVDEATSIGYIYFTVKSSVNGSASIAARNFSKEEMIILHSWHIWIVDDLAEIKVKTRSGSAVESYTLLDRNIGAISANAEDDNAQGFIYQWGRKDPLNNYSRGINNEPDINPHWANLFDTNPFKYGQRSDYTSWRIESFGTLCAWISLNDFPLSFFFGLEAWGNGNWCSNRDGTDFSNGPEPANRSLINLWYGQKWYGYEKSIFDPCPVGYRVPTANELYAIQPSSDYSGWVQTNGETAKIPSQPYYDHTATLVNANNLLWTATGYLDQGYYNAFIYNPKSNVNNKNDLLFHTFAFPVRCIKENR